LRFDNSLQRTLFYIVHTHINMIYTGGLANPPVSFYRHIHQIFILRFVPFAKNKFQF